MLLKLAAVGGLGYLAYRQYDRHRNKGRAAFAADEPDGDVRNAGPEAMRDKPEEPWDEVDQEVDESFPASDPPANY